MSTIKIEDEAWSKVVEFLRRHPRAYVGNEAECRRFVEGVLWIARTGAQWRELPKERFGNWNSVYKRYARWCDHGVWDDMHQHFADDPDMEYLIPDSTVIRAHPCAAGAPAEKGGSRPKRWDAVVAGSAQRFTLLSMHWAIPSTSS